jgi:predicted AAA+ superfamily ATPase
MKRIYEQLISEHLTEYRQMAFLSGPRQVGKTTSSQAGAGINKYMNWDNQSDRLIISRGPDAAAKHLGLSDLSTDAPHIVFDEIHKYRKWKSFLKGFFDIYGDRCRSVVTGSARLNVFKRGGDSLMGRYFLYRMHPLSVAELLNPGIPGSKIRLPEKIDKESFQQLLAFGGFPEPFLKNNARFYNKWKRLRSEQFFYEDIRDITQVYETGQIRVFADLIKAGAGSLSNYSWYATNTNVSIDTVRRWLGLLETLYYCFIVRPWFRNIPKSLRKQPKVYLWDWSIIEDPGARIENFLASQLLKAVHYWTDTGLGDYELYFIRDKVKREVDFLVTQNSSPWFLVEVKSSGKRGLNPNLEYFHELLKTDHAFQVALDLDYVEPGLCGT